MRELVIVSGLKACLQFLRDKRLIAIGDLAQLIEGHGFIRRTFDGNLAVFDRQFFRRALQQVRRELEDLFAQLQGGTVYGADVVKMKVVTRIG